jgi:hypothetical protein
MAVVLKDRFSWTIDADTGDGGKDVDLPGDDAHRNGQQSYGF